MRVQLRKFDNLGDRMRYVRQLSDLTQKEMGEVVNVSTKSIYFYEKNKFRPSNEVLIAYSNLSGLPTDWFLKGEVIYEKR